MSNQFPEPTFTPPEPPSGTVLYIADWWLDALRRADKKARAAGLPPQRTDSFVLPLGAMYLLTDEEFYFVTDLIGAE